MAASIKVKKAGVYVTPLTVFAKRNGTYAAVAGMNVKQSAIYAAIDSGAAIDRYVSGVAERVYAPKPSRIVTAGGDLMFDFGTVTPAMGGTGVATVSISTNYRYGRPQASMLTCTTAGSLIATYTTSGIPTYDQAKPYVITIYNGRADPAVTSGCAVSIRGAGGKSQAWSISGTGLKPGWNTLYLCSVTDTVAQGDAAVGGYASQSGVVQLGTTAAGGMHGVAITSIQVTFNATVAVGSFFVVGSIETATKVRPAVIFTYDQAYTDTDPNTAVANPFLNEILPAFTAAGLVGSCRYHRQLESNVLGKANVQAAVNAGWDVNNGTTTRATTVDTSGLVNSEYVVNGDYIVADGFQRPVWANPPGNNTNTNTETLKSALNAVGIKYSKGTQHSAIYHGSLGIGNQMSIGVTALDGLTGAQISGLIDSAIAAGTHLLFFSHFPKLSQTPSELAIGLAYAASKKTAGAIDVMHLTDFAKVLDGQL